MPKIPDPSEILYAPHGIKFWIGGHPANLAVDLVQLGMGPKTVGVALPIGQGPAGRFVEDFLRARKLRCFFQWSRKMDAGRVLILVESGKDKRFISDVGANSMLSFEHVVRALRASSPRVLYLACGILGQFDGRIREIFRLCREMGVLTILDVLQPLGKRWDFIYPALPYADVIHSNQQELEGITGSSDARKGLKFLARKGVGLAIFSNADKGVTALYRDRFIVQPSFQVEAIDPTGAGDALCAGIARTLSSLPRDAKFHEDLPDVFLSRMLLYSQAAGAACVGEIGTTAGVTKARVHRLVDTEGEEILRRTVVERGVSLQ